MKWHKFLENYLFSSERGGFSAMSVVPELASLPLLRAHLAARKKSILIAPGSSEADAVHLALTQVASAAGITLNILLLPETERGKLRFPGAESRRAQALDKALSGDYDILLGSVTAFTGAAPLPDESVAARILLKPGLLLPPEELVKKLLQLDYDDEYETTIPGEFSRRGGIIDLYSPAHNFPCRVEYFGDEIDTMRSFAPETQRSTGKIDSYQLIGRSGISAGGEAGSDAIAYFEKEDFLFLNLFPDASRSKLRRYAPDKELERFDALTCRCQAEKRERSFHALAPDETPEEFAAPDILPVFEKRTIKRRSSREESEKFHLTELKQKINQINGNDGAVLITARDEQRLEKQEFCDLVRNIDVLIIDDLGTEKQSDAKYQELLEILNERSRKVGKGLRTIISTNLSQKNMFRYYDERIASRIYAEFTSLKFIGENIRFKKK